MEKKLQRIFEKQGYAVVGNHSTVKLCHWLGKSLLFNTPCYKQIFYGIESHRCLQMTTASQYCTQKCLFCWRFQGFTETKINKWELDDPQFIFENIIEAQQRLVSGFKGDERCNEKKWNEAREPRHIACSLTGEPTLYPYLSDFFEICHRNGLTTFLVTNGTTPKALENMDVLPTQLYISISAPNEETYKKLCSPLIKGGWNKINETMELLPSLNTRTVIRHTLINEWNLGYETEYAKLDKIAEPWFIEPKGYVFVGYSRQRLTLNNMPSHAAIKKFGKKLASILGYELIDESEPSRVVLLGRGKERML